MAKHKGLPHRLVFLFLVLALVGSTLLAACGGSSSTPTATVVSTATPTGAPTATVATTTTPTPTPNLGPVKIGAMMDYSGPASMTGTYLADPAIKLLDYQVKQMGGILGGRPVQFVKYDSAGTAAAATAGYTKLVTGDHVSVVLWGGATGPSETAAADAAEQLKVLYVGFGIYPTDMSGRKYTIHSSTSQAATSKMVMDFVMNQLKPKTIGYLGNELTDVHQVLDGYKKITDAAGINTVYEDFVPLGTTDFTAYLTKIKYNHPDVLVSYITEIQSWTTIGKQIMDLGGWGSTKSVCAQGAGSDSEVMKLPGMQGAYSWAQFVSGLPFAGAKKFETEFQSVNGRAPTSNDIYFYVAPWMAIKIIQAAGTDNPAAIAQISRSGKVQWDDSPLGNSPLILGTDGEVNLPGVMVQAQNGQAVLVYSQ